MLLQIYRFPHKCNVYLQFSVIEIKRIVLILNQSKHTHIYTVFMSLYSPSIEL